MVITVIVEISEDAQYTKSSYLSIYLQLGHPSLEGREIQLQWDQCLEQDELEHHESTVPFSGRGAKWLLSEELLLSAERMSCISFSNN